MNAAIYARKSTDQLVADEAKSVTRQEELARAFALKQGWTVSDVHVYIDDGISGAEFEKRPGFMQMMSALQPRAPFQRLIVSERKSIGREQNQTGYVIKQLAEAGVEIFEYVHGKSLTPRNAMDKFMSNAQGYADEQHREASSERVHEAHTRLHSAGHVVGGRVFGYRNVDVFKGEDQHGRPLRSHVEREIDPIEAAVVRRIFELYDSGLGLKRIAKLLTSERAAHPKPSVRTDGLLPIRGWATSTVRDVLTRETYRGVVIWNKTKKRNSWGKWEPTDRPESEWVRTQVESLRIIDEALWQRVVSLRKEVEGKAIRFAGGRLSGRPPKHATVNLLAGSPPVACAAAGSSWKQVARNEDGIPSTSAAVIEPTAAVPMHYAYGLKT
jgi:site-specific DNA recombinase